MADHPLQLLLDMPPEEMTELTSELTDLAGPSGRGLFKRLKHHAIIGSKGPSTAVVPQDKLRALLALALWAIGELDKRARLTNATTEDRMFDYASELDRDFVLNLTTSITTHPEYWGANVGAVTNALIDVATEYACHTCDKDFWKGVAMYDHESFGFAGDDVVSKPTNALQTRKMAMSQMLVTHVMEIFHSLTTEELNDARYRHQGHA